MNVIDSYMAIAVQSKTYGCTNREEIKKNLDTLVEQIEGCFHVMENFYPVKLIVLTEGAIQGFFGSHVKMDYLKECREIAITLPGPETDRLAELAQKRGVYIVAQAKVVEPEIMEDRFFNTYFIIDPDGQIIHRHRKSRVWPPENSTTPYDIYDIYKERVGSGLDAFYPVADTPIGRIGTMICWEGYFTETGRMLALNGAEIICRGGDLEYDVNLGIWEVMNRAHAVNNSCYLIGANNGPKFLTTDESVPSRTGASGGGTMVVNYRGQIMSQVNNGQVGFAASVINLQELRKFRTEGRTALLHQIPAQLYADMYADAAKKFLWPRDLHAEGNPPSFAERTKVYEAVIEKMIENGVYKAPARLVDESEARELTPLRR